MFVRIVLLAVVAFALWALFARDTHATGPERRYEVRAGDTLWGIASSRYGGDPRETVWKLRERNDLSDPTIHPGQVLVLP